jgi:hypothetical protein
MGSVVRKCVGSDSIPDGWRDHREAKEPIRQSFTGLIVYCTCGLAKCHIRSITKPALRNWSEDDLERTKNLGTRAELKDFKRALLATIGGQNVLNYMTCCHEQSVATDKKPRSHNPPLASQVMTYERKRVPNGIGKRSRLVIALKIPGAWS